MRNLIFLITLYFTSVFSFSQTTTNSIDKYQKVILVWGLAKYHHPELSKGKIDANQAFIDLTNQIETIDYQNVDLFLYNWIQSLKGKYKIQNQNKICNSKKYDWINSENFSTNLKSELENLRNNTNFNYHYASINKLNKFLDFSKDKPLKSFDFNILSHRLLFLSSFWNAMQYWNPNISLTDIYWVDILEETILDFKNATTLKKFEYAKLKLFSKLNDSHSNYENNYFINNELIKFSVVGGIIINDSLVVTTLRNEELTNEKNINLNDVIYKVENQDFKTYFKNKFKDKVSTSNELYLKSQMENFFALASEKDSIEIEYVKQDKSKHKRHIKTYELKNLPDGTFKTNHYLSQFKTLDSIGNVGYINLERINKKELDAAFKEFSKKKGIIIDLRNYPRHISADDIAKHIYPSKQKFISVAANTKLGCIETDIKAPLKLLKNPFITGKENSNFYKRENYFIGQQKNT